MQILVNNEEKTITDNATISQALTEIDVIDTKGIAVAINDAVIPKSIWNNHQIQEKDNLLIITATAGG